MAECIEWKELENTITIAANRKEIDCETWVRSVYLQQDVPTVDVALVMHGEWEPIINAYRELEGWMCKCCGTETKQKSNYCPSCGSRMDGGSE